MPEHSEHSQAASWPEDEMAPILEADELEDVEMASSIEESEGDDEQPPTLEEQKAFSLRTYAENKQGRPLNTQRAYLPKQKEFTEHCKKRRYTDNDDVSEDKLLYFLKEDVAKRPLKRHRNKAEPGTSLADTRLKFSSLNAYAKAMVDLWKSQRYSARGNSNEHPRGSIVNGFLNRCKNDQSKNSGKDSSADKGRNTFLDSYTGAQLRKMVTVMWHSTEEEPAETKLHLRTLADLLLSHFTLSRANDRGRVQLSDMFTDELEDEGPTPCKPLFILSRHGKTNQFGRPDVFCVMRNADVGLCTVSAVAFYLLARFDLQSEPFPDLRLRSSWYNIWFMPGERGGSEMPLPYRSQYDCNAKVFALAGVKSAKKTHAGRGAGTRMADNRDVPIEEIRRAGHWNEGDAFTGCYLPNYSTKFMRRMAGFPEKKGFFYLPRAIEAPAALRKLIWPELNDWSPEFGGAETTGDTMGDGFVELLLSFRDTILQDAPFIMERHPSSSVWRHPVFRHPEFTAYKRQVLATTQERPQVLVRLEQVAPDITECMTTMNSQVANGVDLTTSKLDLTTSKLDLTTSKLDSITEKLDLMAEDNRQHKEETRQVKMRLQASELRYNHLFAYTMQLSSQNSGPGPPMPTPHAQPPVQSPAAYAFASQAAHAQLAAQSPAAYAVASQAAAPPTPHAQLAAQSPAAYAFASQAAHAQLAAQSPAAYAVASQAAAPPTPHAQLANQYPAAYAVASQAAAPPTPHAQLADQYPAAYAVASQAAAPPTPHAHHAPAPPITGFPAHTMRRDTSTVLGLWEEWTIGVFGGPSIKQLDAQYGAKWRQTPGEREWYSKRNEVIREVAHRRGCGQSEEEALQSLKEEHERSRKSFSVFCTALRRARQAREKP